MEVAVTVKRLAIVWATQAMLILGACSDPAPEWTLGEPFEMADLILAVDPGLFTEPWQREEVVAGSSVAVEGEIDLAEEAIIPALDMSECMRIQAQWQSVRARRGRALWQVQLMEGADGEVGSISIFLAIRDGRFLAHATP